MGEPRGVPADPNDYRVIHAVRDAAPTRRHGEMLFAMVLEQLGDRAWLDTANDGAMRALYLREAPGSPWLVPWPLLRTVRGGREGPSAIVNIETGETREPPPRPFVASKLRDMGPGSLEIFDGADYLKVNYGGDGRWFEMTRGCGPEGFAAVLDALAAGGAPAVEILATFVLGLDAAGRGEARLRMPVPVPGGPRSPWYAAVYALRTALFRERIPGAARWAGADGWSGAAVAFGATREAAVEAWLAEAARVRPAPAPPPPPPPPLPEPPAYDDSPGREPGMTFEAGGGSFSMFGTIRGPKSDVAPVEPGPGTTPSAFVPLCALPAGEPPLGGWTRLLGTSGATRPAALRLEKGGFTLVGDLLLPGLDVDRLEEALAEADAREAPPPSPPEDFPWPTPATDTRLRRYKIVDDATGAPCRPLVEGASWSAGFDPRNLDGDILRRRVVRVRPEKRPGFTPRR